MVTKTICLVDFKISKDFRLSEFEYSNIITVEISTYLLDRLRTLEDILEKPVYIISVYGNKDKDNLVFSAASYNNMICRKVDIKVNGISSSVLQGICERAKLFNKVQTYNKGIFLQVSVLGTNMWFE